MEHLKDRAAFLHADWLSLGRSRPGRRRRRDHHLAKTGHLENRVSASARMRDCQTPPDRLELLVILEQQPEAGRAEIIDLGEVQFDMMAARADGVVDGLADTIGPDGVK